MNDSKIEKAMMDYNNPYSSNNEVKVMLDNCKKKVNENCNNNVLYKCLNSMDITSLHTTDTVSDIIKFTDKINALPEKYGAKANVAAVCVYPALVKTVKERLNDNIKIAAVTGGFPHSQTFMEVKVAETLLAINEGADEIDIVMQLGKFKDGDFEGCADEISELKECCKNTPMKVILETGLLKSYDDIYKASILALEAGADFIKTSTGKEKPAATPEAALIMCSAIKDFNIKRGEKRGLKVAGGISTSNDAVLYYTIVNDVLGDEWLNNSLFRIGASSLANDLLSSINGKEVRYF